MTQRTMMMTTLVFLLSLATSVDATIKKLYSPGIEVSIADYGRDGFVVGSLPAARFFDTKFIPLRIAIKNTSTSTLVVSQSSLVQPSKELLTELLKGSALKELLEVLCMMGWCIGCISIIDRALKGKASGATLAMGFLTVLTGARVFCDAREYNKLLYQHIENNFLYTTREIPPNSTYNTIVMIDKHDLWQPIMFTIHDTNGYVVASHELAVELANEQQKWHGRLKL